MQALNRIFFGTVSTLAFPLVFLWALLNKKLRVDIQERLLFGNWIALELERCIWIHAASVGELQGVTPLLSKIRAKTSDPIIITTTSLTGRERASQLPEVGSALLIPYDHPFLIAAAIRKVKPRLFLLFETELWPNLLLQLDKAGVPIALINGRISDQTFPDYVRFKFLVKPLLQTFTKCLVQSSKDRTRFELLGSTNVKIEGSTKYDIDLRDISKEADKLKEDLKCPKDAKLLVCGSVRPGESEIILDAFKRLHSRFPELRLLIAPRHPDQFEVEAKNAAAAGYVVSKRTDPKENAEVFILDSLGELKTAYAASTISFVGGTLVNVGGHNPLEPASFSKPILLGPHTQNVEEIADELEESGGAIRVNGSFELSTEVSRLLADDNYLAVVGKHAFEVLKCHSGAVARIMEELSPLLDSDPVKSNSVDAAYLILKPLELLYRLATTIRNVLYDKDILKSYKSSLPVICVGNVTVGGNAKSPVTQAVARLLIDQEFKPVILLRGYSGTEAGPIEVKDPTEVLRFGDEACMHKLEIPSVSVVVSGSRSAGAKYIEENKLGDVIVMDDGFQHRAIKRDINLLLFDSASVREANSGELLPLGRLRESLFGALERADAVCFIERGEKITTPGWVPATIPSYQLPLEFSDLVFQNIQDAIGWKDLRGKSVSLIASIAKPASFKSMIEAQGIHVKQTIFKSDHAKWDGNDLAAIVQLPGDYIITTAKDRIKLKNIGLLPDRLLVAELKATIPNDFSEWLVINLSLKP